MRLDPGSITTFSDQIESVLRVIIREVEKKDNHE